MRILYHPRKLARVEYGLLYNYPAIADIRNIAPLGWHVPTKAEFDTLIAELGGLAGLSEKLRETGIIYWQDLNTGATNSSGWNGRGAGHRIHDTGLFEGLKNNTQWRTSTAPFGVYDLQVVVNNTEQLTQFYQKEGVSLRLLKDDSTPVPTMKDNNGYIYPCVTIGTQVWMAANLKTTEYRTGDAIPEVTDNSAWAALTTGALCAYNNDWNNV
jgi:uncharacterized protein (TIGR02145 family)